MKSICDKNTAQMRATGTLASNVRLLGKLTYETSTIVPVSKPSRIELEGERKKKAPRNEPLRTILGNSSRQRPVSPKRRDPIGAENRRDDPLRAGYDVNGQLLESGASNPPRQDTIPAAPIKRPRGRPRKNPTADVPQRKPTSKIIDNEQRTGLPPRYVVCADCDCKMLDSYASQHECTRAGLGLSTWQPSGRQESLETAPKRREFKGKKRCRPEDDKNGEEMGREGNRLEYPAKRAIRDDNYGDRMEPQDDHSWMEFFDHNLYESHHEDPQSTSRQEDDDEKKP